MKLSAAAARVSLEVYVNGLEENKGGREYLQERQKVTRDVGGGRS